MKWLWDRVSDKHHVFVTCMTMSLIAVFAFSVEVYNDETLYQIGHRHAKQYIVFNTDSINNHTNMIIASRDESSTARDLFQLKVKYWDHEAKLYDLVDTKGNFKNQFHKTMWERQDDELKKELDKFEKKLKGHTSEFESRMMFASRDR